MRDVGLRAAGTQPSSARGPEALQRVAGLRELEAAQEAIEAMTEPDDPVAD